MKLKVCVLGPKQSGKTSLSRLLTSDVSDINKSSIPELRTVYSEDKKTVLAIFDMPSESIFKSINEIFAKGTDVFIYCIDLSQVLNVEKIEFIKNECKQLKTQYPNAFILLAGTKADIAFSKDFFAITQAFMPFLLEPTTNISPEALEYFASIQKIKNARDRFLNNPGMCQALDNLAMEIRHQTRRVQIGIAREIEQLTASVFDHQIMDKTPHIQAFKNHCNELAYGNKTLQNILISIAAAAVVTILAGLLGFFIGFSLGAWTGPGAFFTGLAAGVASAITVAIAAPSLGVCTMSYCAYKFYQPTPLQELFKEVSEQAEQCFRT